MYELAEARLSGRLSEGIVKMSVVGQWLCSSEYKQNKKEAEAEYSTYIAGTQPARDSACF